MKMDGVSAIALVLIASFAIDRLVSGVLFLLTWTHIVTDPATAKDAGARFLAERWYKVWYYALAGVLAIVVMAYLGNVHLLRAMLPAVSDASNSPFLSVLDTLVTGLALMGGAERLSALLKGAAPEKADAPVLPVEVRGKLTLEDGGTTRVAKPAQ